MRAADRASLQAWRYLHGSVNQLEKPPVKPCVITWLNL
jgi:hypothetical protein